MDLNTCRIILACLVCIRIGGATVIPSDRSFRNQIQHIIQNPFGDEIGLLHTPEAWSITTGSPKVRVAILSSGINDRVREFAGRLVPGFNFLSGTTNTLDTQGGGTCIATVLGANANNPDPHDPSGFGYGMVGVDWACEIMPIKVIDGGSVPSKEDRFAQGIDFAAANGCKIILLDTTSSPKTSAYEVGLGPMLKNSKILRFEIANFAHRS
jgi:subtilisin family serine protease